MSDEIRKQWCKDIISKYPYLLPRNSFTGEVSETYDYSYIVGEHDLPRGWFQLFLQMCEDIYEPLVRADYVDKFRFSDVKEKYGTMRCYTVGATREAQDIIDKYEFLSKQVCSVCGIPATVVTYGYICPYCTEHVRGSMEHVDEAEIIELKTSYVKRRWMPERTENVTVDCSDEWYRYLTRIGYTDET